MRMNAHVAWWVATMSGCCALHAGEVVPASLKDAVPNTWVKVAGAPGPRSSFGLIYLPVDKSFVCFGGSMATNPETDKNATNSERLIKGTMLVPCSAPLQ